MRQKNDSPYPRPPIDWGMLWQVLKAHSVLLGVMVFCGCLCLLVVLITTCGESVLGWFSGRYACSIEFPRFAIGLLFLPAGIFLIYFGITSNLSSISYYYDKSQFKRHGLNIIGTVESKEESAVDEDVVERLLSYRYEFNGQSWQAADIVNNARVFAALQPGQDIPLRLLPHHPQTCAIRERSVLYQLKRADSESKQDDDDQNGQLLTFDEE